MNHMRHAGVSLLEMMIALAMFSMIMAAVLNAMNGISSYVTQEETQNDFEMQGVLAILPGFMPSIPPPISCRRPAVFPW